MKHKKLISHLKNTNPVIVAKICKRIKEITD